MADTTSDTTLDATRPITRVLGIDPGLNITGYGVLDVSRAKPRICEAGVIRGGSAKRPMADRLGEIHEGLTEVIQTFKPGVMVIEQLYSHYERPKTAILMGHARGVICLAGHQAGIPVESIAATQVKKLLTGAGHAPKEQMQHAIQFELGLSTVPEPADVADALAIALCYYYMKIKPAVRV